MTATWPAFIGGAALVFVVFNAIFAWLYWIGDQPIANVPDGAAEVRVWHPDQLIDQPAAPLQVAGTVASDTKLNFTPRKRPPPVRKGEYDF